VVDAVLLRPIQGAAVTIDNFGDFPLKALGVIREILYLFGGILTLAVLVEALAKGTVACRGIGHKRHRPKDGTQGALFDRVHVLNPMCDGVGKKQASRLKAKKQWF
tara:strand:+ start:337 stop:654 length:318 start_codon:yes stop_codon:yes gene_type:complete